MSVTFQSEAHASLSTKEIKGFVSFGGTFVVTHEGSPVPSTDYIFFPIYLDIDKTMVTSIKSKIILR